MTTPNLNPDNIAHTGRLYRYKPDLMQNGGHWKESWAVLLNDSTFFWYNDKRCSDLRGTVVFGEVFRNVEIADGLTDKFGPKVLKPPLSMSPDWMFAIPLSLKSGGAGPSSKKNSQVAFRQYQWFCAKNENDISDWVAAFVLHLHQENQFDSLKKALLATQRPISAVGNVSYERSGSPVSGERLANHGHWGYVWDEIKNALKTPGDLSARPSLISGPAEYQAILRRFDSDDASSIERFVSVSQQSFGIGKHKEPERIRSHDNNAIELELISGESKSERLVGGTKKTPRYTLHIFILLSISQRMQCCDSWNCLVADGLRRT